MCPTTSHASKLFCCGVCISVCDEMSTTTKLFHLLGEPLSTAKEIQFESTTTYGDLRHLVAAHFAIVEPSGIGFISQDSILHDVPEIAASDEIISITIDGKAVREIPGPKGLPVIGNFFEVYPDHLGNHQRLFEQYGPIFKTTDRKSVV